MAWVGRTNRTPEVAGINADLESLAGRYQSSQNASSGNPLVDFFSSVIKPVGQSVVATIGGSGAGSLFNLSGNRQKDQDDFVKWVYGTDDTKDAYAKNLGAALKTAGTAASFIPGAGAIAGNIAGGAVQGFGDEYYDRGRKANLGSALGRGITGAVSEGLTAGILGRVNKLAGGTGKLGKALNFMTNPSTIRGNITRGALSGGVGGGMSAFGNTLAAGGSLEDALNSIGGGIGGGALAGGVMGGTLGLGSKGLNKIRSRIRGVGQDNSISTLGNAQEESTGVPKQIAIDKSSIIGTPNRNVSYSLVGKEHYDNVGNVLGDPDYVAKRTMAEKKYYDSEGGRYDSPIFEISYGGRKARFSNPFADDSGFALTPTEQLELDGSELLSPIDTLRAQSLGLDNKLIPTSAEVDINTIIDSLNVDAKEVLSKIDSGQPVSDYEFNNLSRQLGYALGIRDAEAYTPKGDVAISDSIEAKRQPNSNRTSTSSRLHQASAQKLLDQYGTIDKPTARSVDALDSVRRVSDAGFVKPADVERISQDLASGNGKVPKLTRSIVANAKPVNIDDITVMVDDLIESQGLVDADAKSVRNIINAQMNRINGGRRGSISNVADPNNVFDVMKALEKRSADLKGKSGNNYRLTTPERADKAFVLDAIHNELEDRLYSGANVSAALTPEVRNDLVALAPNNAKWKNYVDNTIMKAQNPGELRSSIAPFVRMNRLIENQYMNYGTAGASMSRAQKGIANTLSKIPLVGAAAESIINSPASNRLQSRALDAAAGLADNAPVTATAATPSAPASALVPDWLQAISRQSVARSQGQNAMTDVRERQNAQVDQDIASALNDFAAQGGNIDNLSIPEQVSGQSAGNILSALNGTQSPMGSQMQMSTSNSSQPTLTLDDGTIVDLQSTERAMLNAMMAGDVNAYERLASIYDILNAAYERQAESNSPSQTKLSATQQRANAAGLALDELAQMEPDFGYSVSNMPVLGGIVNLQGNNYESAARSLATQIGFMMSGANISEGEAFNIGKSYIPQPQDDKATRQAKLNRARNIIQQYQNTYVAE